MRNYFYSILAVAMLVSVSHGSFAAEDTPENNPWSATLFYAKKTNDTVSDTFLFTADFPDSLDFVSLAVARKIGSYKKTDLEFEGQIARHQGIEHYTEYTAAIFIRWETLPWDDVIDMSFAFAEGFSYTTRIPQFESENNKPAARFLNYLAYEMTFALPKYKNWEAVLRMHHRSGIFGLFNGVHGASNAWAIGLRYNF